MNVHGIVAFSLLAISPRTFTVTGTHCDGDKQLVKNGSGVLVKDWTACREVNNCNKVLLLTSQHVVQKCHSITITELTCNGETAFSEIKITAPTKVRVWPNVDIAAIELGQKSALVNVAVSVAEERNDPRDREVQLFAWNQYTGCPTSMRPMQVGTLTLGKHVRYLIKQRLMRSTADALGSLTEKTKIYIYADETYAGMSGGALWHIREERVIGVHVAGFSNRPNLVEGTIVPGYSGWAIQIPSTSELGNCGSENSDCKLATLGDDGSWPDQQVVGRFVQSFSNSLSKTMPGRYAGLPVEISMGTVSLITTSYDSTSVLETIRPLGGYIRASLGIVGFLSKDRRRRFMIWPGANFRYMRKAFQFHDELLPIGSVDKSSRQTFAAAAGFSANLRFRETKDIRPKISGGLYLGGEFAKKVATLQSNSFLGSFPILVGLGFGSPQSLLEASINTFVQADYGIITDYEYDFHGSFDKLKVQPMKRRWTWLFGISLDLTFDFILKGRKG